MRSTKKKQRGGRAADMDSDDEESTPSSSNKPAVLQLIAQQDVKKELKSQSSLADCPDELFDEISSYLLP